VNRPTKIAVILVTGALVLAYAGLVLPAYNGAGYATASERSYRSGSTYFFWGSGRIFRGPSVRNSSRGGPGVRGGGFRGGK